MPPQPARAVRISNFVETIVIAAAGGGAFALVGVPAGWMSGAFLAVMIAAVAGRPLWIPSRVAQIVFVMLGILLGGAITPDSLHHMSRWPLSLALLTGVIALITAALTLYLKWVHGWDSLSALFASAPGALSQSLALAAQMGADVRSVAMVQSVRLLVFTVGLPVAMGFVTIEAAHVAPALPSGPAVSGSLIELLALIAASVACAGFAFWLNVPGGLILGAMLASGILHGSGAITVNVPNGLAVCSFVALGAMIGARFVGLDVRMLRHLAGAALGALALATVLAFGCALAAAALLSMRMSDMFLAYVPGGLEAMTILAFALKLDPALVGSHHLARYLFLSLAVPLVAVWINRRRKPD